MSTRLYSALLAGAVVTSIVTATDNVQAFSLDFAGSNLKSVSDLNINGNLFEVDFQSQNYQGSFQGTPLFLDDQLGAIEAANALAIALNSSGFVNDPNSTFGDGVRNSFLIPFSLTSGNPSQQQVTSVEGEFNNGTVAILGSFFTDGVTGSAPQSASYAVFTQTGTTAVPTPALLPGLIGFSMSIVRKRKKQQVDGRATT